MKNKENEETVEDIYIYVQVDGRRLYALRCISIALTFTANESPSSFQSNFMFCFHFAISFSSFASLLYSHFCCTVECSRVCVPRTAERERNEAWPLLRFFFSFNVLLPSWFIHWSSRGNFVEIGSSSFVFLQLFHFLGQDINAFFEIFATLTFYSLSSILFLSPFHFYLFFSCLLPSLFYFHLYCYLHSHLYFYLSFICIHILLSVKSPFVVSKV